MIKKYFGDKVRKAKSSERAEAMPAAIITAIVSSLLLLGIAGAVSLVVQQKADSEGNVALATIASNIDVSLRSDVTSASYISASAKLQQPSTRLLSPTDIRLNGVNMHIPESTGECKVIRWNINGNTASRDLTIYKSSTNKDSIVKCDETSQVVAERNKVFADDVKVNAPFKFYNQVGRELAFTLEQTALDKVNIELDKQLTAKGVTKLNDADFNALNSTIPSGSFAVGFSDPAACVMNQKEGAACAEPESDTVAAAWNSLKIAKVSVAFEMSSDSGETVKRNIEQNSSVPLYASAAEAEASVANSSADDRPAAPVVSLSTSNIILGSNYTVNWTQGGVCPIDMTGVYKLYENGKLISTIAYSTAQAITKNYTNSAIQNLNYTVQTECVRGAHVVNSDMSAAATGKVIPAVPALTITAQPATTNAALNSNLSANAVCLYGTTPKYKVTQNAATYGTAGTVLDNLASVNRAINNGFNNIVAGARYQYTVAAWCESAFENSSSTNKATNSFTTAIKAPATPVITAPLANAVNVATDATVAWNTVTCEVGSSPRFYAVKNVNGGATITAQVIRNWTTDLNLASANTQGNTVGYAVKALCQGTAVPSANSADATVRYTTLINNPAATTITSPGEGVTNVPTNATVTWSSVVCPTGTTTQYYAVKNMDKGAVSSQVINNWTTATSLISNNTEGNKVGYSAATRCAGPNANSTGTAPATVTYTTLITAPAGPAFTAPADNATNVPTNATVTWSSVVCPTGTTTQYYATKDVNAGSAVTAQVIRNWTTDLNLVSANTEGNTVGYTVEARCAGPNVSSVSSAQDALAYTTLINNPLAPTFTAPAKGATVVPTNVAVTWSSVVCPTGTTTQYYATKNINAGSAITAQVIRNWTTDLILVSANTEGNTVGYTVAARCAGPNASSTGTANDTLSYTTLINTPAAPVITTPAVGATNVATTATVAWAAAVCAPSTVTQYYATKNMDRGAGITAQVIRNWTTNLNLPTSNTEGNLVGYDVKARCVGPNVTSGDSAADTVTYTTAISAPATPNITVPSEGQMDVSTTANVWFDAVICATGTTPQYYSVKNLHRGVALTPQVVQNWTTARSFATSNTEGNKVGYTVTARCAGPNANSASSGADSVTYTTVINAPAMPTFTAPVTSSTGVAVNATIRWTAVTCATGTTVQYHTVKTYDAGVRITNEEVISWTGAVSAVTSNNEGNFVGYAVQARCVGPNDTSANTGWDYNSYTTVINAPAMPVFTAPSPKGTTDVATSVAVTWSAVTCATGATVEYYSNKVLDKGATIADIRTYGWGSGRAFTANNTEGNRVGYEVMARCVGPNATSVNSAADVIHYTTLINTPVAPVITAPAEGATGISTTQAIAWNAVTCPTGTTASYYPYQYIDAYYGLGVQASAWQTGLTFATNEVQGNRVGFAVRAKCVGPNAESAQSPYDTVTYTTVINAPTAPVWTAPMNAATGISVTTPIRWTAETCATGTTTEYHVVKTHNEGIRITNEEVATWITGISAATSNTQGNDVGYAVQARCVGASDTSSNSGFNYLRYITAINAPAMPAILTPTPKGTTDVATNATVSWSAVTCATGATVEYYSNKVLDKGATIADVRTYGWGSGRSFATSNTQGNRVGYEVMARCVGPNATSANSAADLIHYTTLITAPGIPQWTSPAISSTGVATNATISWGAVTCATGTTTQYHTVKTWNRGIDIPNEEEVTWTTARSVVTSNTQGSFVAYAVQARCAGPNDTSSISGWDYNSYYTAMNAPADPQWTSPVHDSKDVNTAWAIKWNPVTCATGATVQYSVSHTVDWGVDVTPRTVLGWTTGATSYTTNNEEGNRVGYRVYARCVMDNGTYNSVYSYSGSGTNSDFLRYTTKVEVPGRVTAGNNNWSTVDWVVPPNTCNANTEMWFQIKHVKSDNVTVNSYGAWTQNLSRGLPDTNSGGYPQWAEVRAKCVGVNDESLIVEGWNTTKWVKRFDVDFTAEMGKWRRVNVKMVCPTNADIQTSQLYVAAEGWGGDKVGSNVQTDEGAWIPATTGGNGGNTGWKDIIGDANYKYLDHPAEGYDNSTYNWGSTLSGRGEKDYGTKMIATYWNSDPWGEYGYWWYGKCSTPYMGVVGKQYDRYSTDGIISGGGNPGTVYNAVDTGYTLTAAGQTAID